MIRYAYRSSKGRNLRKGDMLRAADGKSWLDPIRDVVVHAAKYGEVQVWIHGSLMGSPDHRLYSESTYRVRRELVGR